MVICNIFRHSETCLRHFETFWDIWDILRYCETFWDILRYFQTFWDILWHFETFWDLFFLWFNWYSFSNFDFIFKKWSRSSGSLDVHLHPLSHPRFADRLCTALCQAPPSRLARSRRRRSAGRFCYLRRGTHKLESYSKRRCLTTILYWSSKAQYLYFWPFNLARKNSAILDKQYFF